ATTAPARRTGAVARTPSLPARHCAGRNVMLRTFRCTHHRAERTTTLMESNLFGLIDIDLHGTSERVLAGGRHLFANLGEAFAGIEQIGVIGWGLQARAQAMNLRDSLAYTDIRVTVGLR